MTKEEDPLCNHVALYKYKMLVCNLTGDSDVIKRDTQCTIKNIYTQVK